VEPSDRPRERAYDSIDPIYGSRGGGFGRSGEAFSRLRDCVRLVRDTEFPDDVAVTMIRDAAGGKRTVLHSFAEHFTGLNWQGDPLLVHVADLVSAAQTGTVPSPVDDATAAVMRDERWLLGAGSVEGFEFLATRQPALRELARQASDPTWRDEQDHSPPPRRSPSRRHGSEVAPGVWASESTPRLARWFLKRTVRNLEQARVDWSNDPTGEELRSSLVEMRSHEGTLVALGRGIARLVGPAAVSDDPLIRTKVALVTAEPYLWRLVGNHPPTLPPRH
jgi:hypothetical protein